MTILYILNSSSASGGASKSFLIMLRGVLNSGHKSIVAVPDEGGICPSLREMGAKVFVLSYRLDLWAHFDSMSEKILFMPRQIWWFLLNLRARRKLLSVARANHCDMIHSNTSVIISLGRYVAEKMHIPHVCHIREYGDLDFGIHYFPSGKSLRCYLTKEGVQTICITRDIQSHFSLENHPNSSVIYNGIVETLSPSVEALSRKYFLYAGRIECAKGVLSLLRAYNAYRGREEMPLPLYVAGDESDADYCHQVHSYVEGNNLGNDIVFLGPCSDMISIYRGAKAIIVPSHFEGFGRCMPEAMSEGCIPIGHNTGGTREQFENLRKLYDYIPGFPYDTEGELAQCLTEVHRISGSEYETMQRQCREAVSSLYSCEQHIKEVIELYEKVERK